jgi:hypothetical protein
MEMVRRYNYLVNSVEVSPIKIPVSHRYVLLFYLNFALVSFELYSLHNRRYSMCHKICCV